MTSVEKRRSGRKSGGHRKHSDGGYSDTSSGGSFLDETDREVSSLTDRAFRSLCIGDEAVYNDSDLCSSSPCIQRDRQLAFSHSGLDGDREEREREELKRAAHESFSLRVQQYGPDWIHGGMYGAEIPRDPQWEVYGERTQGRVSATFQHSFVETSQQQESLREEQLSFLSNGATELNSQQRRSRSRVSSLIRAFNSEGHRDGAGTDGQLRDWNKDTSWDKSALMSIQRELSEFSTSYQQDFNSGHFPSAGPFSPRDGNFYSSELAAAAHMNSASSFMRSSHSKHSMSTQVNCNSNFFIHSEFSPFKVWRDHNRFPFQQGQVSGFMHCSEFPKWYETPMYKELSLEAQHQGLYRFEERGFRHQRNNFAPVVPPTPPRSTSTSTVLQKASAVEKRCESELAGYPHRKRTQSLGTNRLPSQRPSTASPSIEMSRRVQDTISSVKALQQKIKMMTEQNITTGMMTNQQGVIYSNNNSMSFGGYAKTETSQQLTPSAYAHQEAEASEVRQYAASPQPVEHPPVRAESRGATPDVRTSSYRSRASSLLFNLKDNRKRVKSTYSPTKFKGLETLEKNKVPSVQEHRDTVIDIPDLADPDVEFAQVEEYSRTNDPSCQHVNQYYSPGVSLSALNSQLATAHTGQYSEYNSSDFRGDQTGQMQSEMFHHSDFSGVIPENYASNQLANGQNLPEDILSFTPYKRDNTEALEDAYRLKPSYAATEMPRLHADNNQTREYLMSKANADQHFNETVGREFTKVDSYQRLKDSEHDYGNVSSQDRWRQTNSQDTNSLSLKAAISPWKQEITTLMEKDQHAQAYQRAAAIKDRAENKQALNKELEKKELRESYGVGAFSLKKDGLVNTNISNQLPQPAPFGAVTGENPAHYGEQQSGAFKDKHAPQKYYGHNKEKDMTDDYLTQNYNKYTNQEYRNQQAVHSNADKITPAQKTGRRQQYTPIPKGHEMQSVQTIESKPQFEHKIQRDSFSNPDNVSAPTMTGYMKDRPFVEVKADQTVAEHIKVQHAQAELAKAQPGAQVELPKADSATLILAGQTGSGKVKAEQAKSELTGHSRGNQARAEHSRDEEQTEQSREKLLESAREEQTKAEQTRVQKQSDIPEEAGVKQMGAQQGEQVKAEPAEAGSLKEEHIKSDQAKTETSGQAKLQQAKTEQAIREEIKSEQLLQDQVRAEQAAKKIEAERIRAEKIKMEQAEAEQRKAEQAKQEHIKEQQAKAEQEKSKVAEEGKVKANHSDVRQEKAEEDSVQAGQINAKQHTTEMSKGESAEERTAEQTKLAQMKVGLTKTESMQERFLKPSAKLTTAPQVKSEPDKVEQVKTELAKAKAELAKIKEKMRGEQKEKVKNLVPAKEDIMKKAMAARVNSNSKSEENKDQVQPTQTHQQKDDSVAVSRQSADQPSRGAEEYTRLREKYGFTDTTATSRSKFPAANDAHETPAVSLDKAETTVKEESKDIQSPTNRFAMASTKTKEEAGSHKSSEMTESHYVYSESLKEFKLSGANNASGDSVSDKVRNDSVETPEKCDLLKHSNVSQQKDSDLVKSLAHERKPKSTEHSVAPGKESHFTPPKALSHKERAQTKQEILTSKIKAHAEKEISAIKEKGFAIRDGFISKNPTKQSLQSVNVRQRPPSQDVSKKHESTSSNITPKPQMEASGEQIQPVKMVSPCNSDTITLKPAATTSQFTDSSQKQAPKELTKTNDNAPKPPGAVNPTGSHSMGKDEGLVETQKKENQSVIKSPMPSKEQEPKKKLRKQETHHGGNSGKQREGPKDNPVVNTEHLTRKKEDLSQAESTKPTAAEKTETKHEAAHEDTEPSLSFTFGQSESSVGDNSLQIRGIMVTVRERQPSENHSQMNDSCEEHIKEKECRDSELDKRHPSSGAEVSEGNTSSKEAIMANTKAAVHPTVKEDQSKVSTNNTENVQETSTLGAKQNNVSEKVTEKRNNLQQDNSLINERIQKDTQLQEPLAEKEVPSTVTALAKNKVLAQTQPPHYKQDIIAGQSKDYTNKAPTENSARSTRNNEVKSNTDEKKQTMHVNENFTTKVVNAGANSMNDSNRADDETLMKHDIQLPVKEDAMTGRKSTSANAPVLEEKRHKSTQPKQFNTTSPPNHPPENEQRHAEHNQLDDVHIDSIAIRVVPAVTMKENLNRAGKHPAITLPSDTATANEHKQAASPSHEKKVDTLLNNGGRAKDVIPASSEKQKKDSLEDKLGKQGVLSSVRELSSSVKISNQQKSINTASENAQAENEQPEKATKSGKPADISKTQPVEGDYFQVQGLSETNNKQDSGASAGDMSDTVSKGRELPGLISAVTNESYHGEHKESFVLDQSKKKTVESSSLSIQDENRKKKKEDNLASKQSDGPTERQSNKNEKTEADRAVDIRKHHTESRPSLSARERQSFRNSHPTRENAVKEKPEVKPKPKDRASTIPEISAIADYARLKVIVSEDKTNTVQEFPPNKKEGFFPLIQTRHSRRPVFNADPQDLSGKEKSLPDKTEVSSKVNKEPKALVFPIMEREHQRTGMFKLGDKERQEKVLLDAKADGAVSDTGTKPAQHLEERIKSPSTLPKTRGGEEQETGDDIQVHQVDQSVHQSNNPPPQATSASAANTNTLSQHLKPPDNCDPHGKLPSKVERIPCLGNGSHSQPSLGQEEDTKTLRKDERIENIQEQTESTAKAKQQSRSKQSEEERASRAGEEKTSEKVKIRHIIEESRASLADEQRRAAQREEERRAREREAIAVQIRERRDKQREAERRAEEERKAKQTEKERAARKEEEMKAKQKGERAVKDVGEKEERGVKLKEEEEQMKENDKRRREKQQEEERAVQEEQQKRAALIEEQQRRAAQEEQQRKAAQEEQHRKAAQEEQQRRAALIEEEQRKAAQEEQQRRAALIEEQKRKAAQEEQQRKAAQEEQQRRAALIEEQQRKAAQEEQQRKAAQEEQQRRAALIEEQQRKAAQEEQQRRAALIEEQQRKAAQEEQQRKAAQEEQQRKAALIEEQQRKAAQEEQQRRAALIEEQQRKAAQEEQHRKAAQEEQQRKAALIEEQQRKAAQEEKQRRAALIKEQQRKAAQEEQHRRAALIEEQQRKAIQEEQQKRAALIEEQQRKAAQEEQQRKAAQEEQQRKAALIEEQQRKAAQEEQQWKAALIEEQQRKAAQEEKQRRAALIEEQQRNAAHEEQQRKEKSAQFSEKEKLKQTQEQQRAEQQFDSDKGQRQKKDQMRTQREDEERRAAEKEKTTVKQREENPAKEEGTRLLEESQTALKEEKRVEGEWMLDQKEDKIRANKRGGGGEEEKFAAYRDAEVEEQKQRIDALQYYSMSSAESERKDRQLYSPLPSQQRSNPSGLESTEDSKSHTRPYRPHAPISPAPSLPRSNTSSPALGAKPSMFRVKDNTLRSSPFTKSVKPRFHKNFGEDFRVTSPMEKGSEREEEQDKMRRSAGTPDTGFSRLAAMRESSSYSATASQYRPHSRRSIVLDEDDSRSVISNMSEDVESFATSAADLADLRGLLDYERPESACSFSSDVSRSLGKPPAVPPKSEKALRRAKRLTTRRIKKEQSTAATESPAGPEKAPPEVSSRSNPPSSSTEVCSSNRHAVASPHFSPPVSLAHAPALGPSLPSSHTEHQSSRSSFHASPHATGPISLPVASPHATGPISLPVASPHAAAPVSLSVASPHATGPVSNPAAPKTVAHVPSSPTLHHANHPAPVTQYHVESSYPQSYPMTQRKVLQDLGSGQYFVVDVPVQVKTKTFFDPETGKYVQLNVRESAQSTSRPKPQQTYVQPQLQPQVQVKPQQQALTQASPAGKPLVLYPGYHGYPQGYQPAPTNSVPNHMSPAPVSLQLDQQPARESRSYGYPAPETGQSSEGQRYSPEKTPYMDTVTDKDKTYNTVYNTHGPHESFPECDTNSQLAGSSVCENDNSAPSRYQSRDIISMSELEDFMEVSDW